MIQNERDCRHEHVLDVARQMLTAARTAPKGKGIDVIEAALVTGEDIKKLSEKMVAMVEEHGMKFFLRDADNILQAECVIIIGTREQTQGLNCGPDGVEAGTGIVFRRRSARPRRQHRRLQPPDSLLHRPSGRPA